MKGSFGVRFYTSRQGKPGMAEELTRRINEGAKAHYVVYASDDTVTAISVFNDYAGAEE